MRFISVLSGDHLDIARSELLSLLNISNSNLIEEKGRLIVFETDNIETIKKRITFSKYLAALDYKVEPEKKFKIIELRFHDKKSKIDELAKVLGVSVDLENPQVEYISILTDEQDYVGLIIYKRKFDEEIKKFKKRPFNHPSSINPLLARSMINISGVKDNGTIMDPFSGTGTFLIEAGKMGLNYIGIDLSLKMVEGAKSNLRYYDLPDTKIYPGDFKKLVEYQFDSIVTDPPYGRGSKIFSESKKKLYMEFFNILRKKEYDFCVAVPNEEIFDLAKEYLDPKLAGEILVHRSLKRFIITNNKAIKS